MTNSVKCDWQMDEYMDERTHKDKNQERIPKVLACFGQGIN